MFSFKLYKSITSRYLKWISRNTNFNPTSPDYLYTIIKNNRYNIFQYLKENVLGKDELFELETAIPKVYKADADMFTLVPQLPSKYYSSCLFI